MRFITIFQWSIISTGKSGES